MAKVKKPTVEVAGETWRTLPGELTYLVPCLADLYRQSSSRLESGDGDFRCFEKAWGDLNTGSLDKASLSERLDSHRASLEAWMPTATSASVEVLAPVAALVGYMRGMQLFGDGEGWPDAPSDEGPDLPGFLPVMLEIPPGFKAKRLGHEWDIHARGITMVVTGLPEHLWQSLYRPNFAFEAEADDAGQAVLHTHENPRLIFEVIADLQLGEVHGRRTLSRWVDESLPWGASYLLFVPGGHAQVDIQATGKRGLQLNQIEPSLATLKVEPEAP